MNTNLPEGFEIQPFEGVSEGLETLPDSFELIDIDSLEALESDKDTVDATKTKTAPSSNPNEWRALMADFLSDSQLDLENRVNKIKGIKDLEDLTNAPTVLLGQTSGGVFDITANALGAAAGGISILVPDSIEDPVKQTISDGFNYLVNSTAGKYFIDKLNEVDDATQAFQDTLMAFPDAEVLLDSGINLAAMATPSARFKPMRDIDLTESKGKAIKFAAGRKVIENQRADALDVVLPMETLERSKEMVSDSEVKGIFNTVNYKPTDRELDMAKEAQIAGVRSKDIYQTSYLKVDAQIGKLANDLVKRLETSEFKLSPEEIKLELQARASSTLENNPILKSNETLENTFQFVIDRASILIKQYGETPAGMLKARKELDKMIKATDKGGLDPTGQLNAQRLAYRTVRTAMNELVEDATGGKLDVKNSLRRQSLLFEARDNIQDKAAEQAKTAVGRLFQNTSKVLTGKQKLNQAWITLGGVTAGSAATSIAGLLPYFSVGVGAGGVTYLAYKGAMSPKTKAAMGNLLIATNKAINMSKNAGPKGADMLSQLKADKAILLDLMKTPVDPALTEGEEVKDEKEQPSKLTPLPVEQ